MRLKYLLIILCLSILVFLSVLFYLSLTGKINFSNNKLSSCVILDEAYCKKGQPVYYQGQFLGLAFKVPEKVELFAPFKGDVSRTGTYFLDNKKYPSINVTFSPEAEISTNTVSFSAIFFNAEQNNLLDHSVKGSRIGIISNLPIDAVGEYNLVVRFAKYNSSKRLFEINTGLFKQYFDYVNIK